MPGRAQGAAGTLAVVPQPDTGVVALAPTLPLHMDGTTLVQSLHLLCPQVHAEGLGNVGARSRAVPAMQHGAGEQAPALRRQRQAARVAPGDFGPRQDVSRRSPHFGFLKEVVGGRTPLWSS